MGDKMHVHGTHHGEDVGCFFLLRPPVAIEAGPIPVFTIHRVTRRQAHGVAYALECLSSARYQVVALSSECDCMGRAVLEDLVSET